MAKLRAPLFSFGASGKLAKSLVYFGWKGLNVVRSYVIPANPNSTAQQTQRGYLIAAVAFIHSCLAQATDPLASLDKSAYSLLGSLEPTPRTWFNTICRQWMKQKVDSLIPIVWTGGILTPGNGKVTIELHNQDSASSLTNATLYYGTSKSSLLSTAVLVLGDLYAGKEISGLTNGTAYYFQVRPTLPVGFLGSDSGIYHCTPSA
jgi:hypothetical protein